MKLRVSAFHKKTRWSRYWLQHMGQNPMNVPTAQHKENTSNSLGLFLCCCSKHTIAFTLYHWERFYIPKTCNNINSKSPNYLCCCLIQTQTQTNTLKWISIKRWGNVQRSGVVCFTVAEKFPPFKLKQHNSSAAIKHVCAAVGSSEQQMFGFFCLKEHEWISIEAQEPKRPNAPRAKLV